MLRPVLTTAMLFVTRVAVDSAEHSAEEVGGGAAGAGTRTVSEELESQRPMSGFAGKKRRDGRRRSPHEPSGSRSWSANSMRPSSSNCAATRTVTPVPPDAVCMPSACASTVSGELPNQRPTRVFAGKNRALGRRRSSHDPSAARSWSANSVRPSARRCAATRTSTSTSAVCARATRAPRIKTSASASATSTHRLLPRRMSRSRL